MHNGPTEKIVILPNPRKPEAVEMAYRLERFIKEKGKKTIIITDKDQMESPDIILTLGGDGTFLKGFHLFPRTPIIGVHMGSLGFLAFLNPDNAENALNKVFLGKFSVLKKNVLTLQLEDSEYLALNDVVLVTRVSGRLIEFFLNMLGERLHLLADGVIFSSPTGSTAYNFAAHGPVVEEKVGGFVITPLVPHNIAMRSVVLSAKDSVSLSLGPKTDKGTLWIDGQIEIDLHFGETARIFIGEKQANIIVPEGHTFHIFKRLKEKLGWQ